MANEYNTILKKEELGLLTSLELQFISEVTLYFRSLLFISEAYNFFHESCLANTF